MDQYAPTIGTIEPQPGWRSVGSARPVVSRWSGAVGPFKPTVTAKRWRTAAGLLRHKVTVARTSTSPSDT